MFVNCQNSCVLYKIDVKEHDVRFQVKQWDEDNDKNAIYTVSQKKTDDIFC